MFRLTNTYSIQSLPNKNYELCNLYRKGALVGLIKMPEISEDTIFLEDAFSPSCWWLDNELNIKSILMVKDHE